MTSSKAARMMRISSGLKLGMMTSRVRCTSVPDLACAIHTQSREALRRRLGGSRLITVSNLGSAWTGRSAVFSLLRMRRHSQPRAGTGRSNREEIKPLSVTKWRDA